MLNRLLVILPLVSFVAFLSYKSMNQTSSAANQTPNEITNEIAVINPIPVKFDNATVIEKKMKTEKKKKSASIKIKKKKSPKAVQVKENNQKQADLRDAVSEDEMNSVIFSESNKEAKISGTHTDNKYGEVLKKSVQGESKGNVKNSKWIEHLSGVSASVNLRNKGDQDCDNSMSACSQILEKKEISVVGVVVESKDEKQRDNTKTFKGQVNRGDFAENTPALYVK